jgi:hypothetical protein
LGGADIARDKCDELLTRAKVVKWRTVPLGRREGTPRRNDPTRLRTKVIEKYTGVLAGADIFTESTAFWVMESIRLDLGYGSQVHP